MDKGWGVGGAEGWDGEGRGDSRHILRYLLKNLGDESAGRIILNYIIIFKNPKYSINKKIACDYLKEITPVQHLTTQY